MSHQRHNRVIKALIVMLVVVSCAARGTTFAGDLESSINLKDAVAVSAEVDRLIAAELRKANTKIAKLTRDEDFLRRISFDLAGTVPSPRDVTLFGLNPSDDKRADEIERLLDSKAYAENWSRYWRDVIMMRATNQRIRLMQGSFERWMAEQLQDNVAWDKITTAMITAQGDVRENGDTALIFAHEAQATEVAAEVSRIFLGIQIQCANCHDHPTDKWKREQFHELAAFFPRTGQRRQRDDQRSWSIVSVNQQRRRNSGNFDQLKKNAPQFVRFLDRNRDGKITKAEAGRMPYVARLFSGRLLERIDTNKDKALSLAEIQNFDPPPPPTQPGRGSTEHFMQDLNDPTSQGTQINPNFFATDQKTQTGLNDLARRELLSEYLTSPKNEWFSIAFVNRIWAELLGEGFYTPIDDIGPQRSATFPDVLELLRRGFVANDYDIKWLLRTITNTETYQHQIRASDLSGETLPFASATPTRLRADQLYNAIVKVLGFDDRRLAGRVQPGGAGGYGRQRGMRSNFTSIFGFDPSTPQDDLTGKVPQALFMMNSALLHNLTKGDGNTRLARILGRYKDDEDALSELYLLVLAREPSQKELKICTKFIGNVGNRKDAFEDILWSLMNSSEFLSKR